MTKKVLGINFGRVNGNCKKYLTAALEAAKAEGAEIEIIDVMKLKIGHCIGCGTCSKKLQGGQEQISCVVKDDFEALSDAVLATDTMSDFQLHYINNFYFCALCLSRLQRCC